MVIILIGYVLGIILPTRGGSVVSWAIGDVGVEEEGLAMAGVLNLFLLPIIIFEAGWSMNHRAFVDLMLTILTFAVLGTLISMVVVGLLINATCDVHGVCSVRAAFTYAALISAVDPVATLATYAHLQVDPLLNICVFGESVVNDAVAIVLFRVLNTGIASQTSLLLFGSVGLGVLLGFMLMSLGQRCGMSGIITVLFGAMFASAFAKYQFSSEVTMFCAFTLKQAATLADMVVFLMVGITAVYCDVEGLVLGLLVCAFCLVGRAAAVFPLALLTNLCKEMYRRGQPPEKKLTLDWRKIFMMWHAGLRGGIALVLTLELGPWVDQEKPGTKDRLRNATVLVIVVSSVGRFGVSSLARWLRWPMQIGGLQGASFGTGPSSVLAKSMFVDPWLGPSLELLAEVAKFQRSAYLGDGAGTLLLHRCPITI
ncbi:Sodium/hydrogen exchanger 8 (Na(+)/H(+) exchanger 8) (NHE-8) (Solute carrier family 9 member 8) [Durusdinium trenchii]|uniref:Sodium/hydrogen exchanger 8 n=1 Tax=Durusdinium trenchii TaxID=1381693 RepID=A0ABP0QD42_9DINO